MPQMIQWSLDNYPNEACGLIVEGQAGLEVVCCANQQDALHKHDPERFPRTARTAYNIDPRVMMQIEMQSQRVAGVFHSHPDRGAYFSDEDVLAALGGDPAGEPVWPGVDYLVLAATADTVTDARLYSWHPEQRRFCTDSDLVGA